MISVGGRRIFNNKEEQPMKHKQNDHMIVAIHVTNRVKHALSVQKILTSYGANIKTRIGLHDATARTVASSGLILLEVVGMEKQCTGLINKLNALKGVEAKCVVFTH
jgi:hypothetical protein